MPFIKDPFTSTETGPLFLGRGLISHLSLSPDSSLLAGAGAYFVQIWDISSGKEVLLMNLKKTGKTIKDLAISPNNKTLALTNGGVNVGLWSLETGQFLKQFKGHTNQVNTVSFNHDGKKIITASHDGTSKVWNVETKKNLSSTKVKTYSATYPSLDTNEEDSVQKFNFTAIFSAFVPNSSKALTTLNNGVIDLWNTETGDVLVSFKSKSEINEYASFSSDGTKVLFSENGSGKFTLWDISSKKIKELNSFKVNYYNGKKSSYLSPDNQVAAIPSSETGKSLMFLDLKTNKVIDQLAEQDSDIKITTVSKKGKIVAAASHKVIKVWMNHPYLKPSK